MNISARASGIGCSDDSGNSVDGYITEDIPNPDSIHNHIGDFVPRGVSGRWDNHVSAQDSKPEKTPGVSRFYTKQMRNVIEQLLKLYTNRLMIVTLKGGVRIIGRPGSVISAGDGNGGLFVLVNKRNNVREAVPINRIVAIKVLFVAYTDKINFLISPTRQSIGSESDCELSVRSCIPVGTKVKGLRAAGRIIAKGIVKHNKCGVVVLVNSRGSNPVFVATHLIESITT